MTELKDKIVNLEDLKTAMQVFYDTIYPIGAVQYGLTAPTTPNGVEATWEFCGDKIGIDENTCLGIAGTETRIGETLFDNTATCESVAITTAQMPKHSHNKGSMRITGWSSYMTIDRGLGSSAGGVMYANRNDYDGPAGSGGGRYTVGIDTSREDGKYWTGNTNEVGSSQGHKHSITDLKVKKLFIGVWTRTA